MGKIQCISAKSFKTETWEKIENQLEKGNTFIEKGLYNELKKLKMTLENLENEKKIEGNSLFEKRKKISRFIKWYQIAFDEDKSERKNSNFFNENKSEEKSSIIKGFKDYNFSPRKSFKEKSPENKKKENFKFNLNACNSLKFPEKSNPKNLLNNESEEIAKNSIIEITNETNNENAEEEINKNNNSQLFITEGEKSPKKLSENKKIKETEKPKTIQMNFKINKECESFNVKSTISSKMNEKTPSKIDNNSNLKEKNFQENSMNTSKNFDSENENNYLISNFFIAEKKLILRNRNKSPEILNENFGENSEKIKNQKNPNSKIKEILNFNKKPMSSFLVNEKNENFSAIEKQEKNKRRKYSHSFLISNQKTKKKFEVVNENFISEKKIKKTLEIKNNLHVEENNSQRNLEEAKNYLKISAESKSFNRIYSLNISQKSENLNENLSGNFLKNSSNVSSFLMNLKNNINENNSISIGISNNDKEEYFDLSSKTSINKSQNSSFIFNNKGKNEDLSRDININISNNNSNNNDITENIEEKIKDNSNLLCIEKPSVFLSKASKEIEPAKNDNTINEIDLILFEKKELNTFENKEDNNNNQNSENNDKNTNSIISFNNSYTKKTLNQKQISLTSPKNKNKIISNLQIENFQHEKIIENRLRNYFEKNKQKFIKKITKSPPEHFRWIVWIISAKLPEDRLSEFYNKFLKKELVANVQIQIKKDIGRTFPNWIRKKFSFDQEEEKIEICLFRILKAIANNDPELGYCQGMNFIIGFLLITSNFNEIDSYYMMLSLLNFTGENSLGIRGFFLQDFPTLKMYLFIFQYFFHKKLFVLKSHFDYLCIPDELWIFKWLQTLFTIILPYDAVKRLMDCILTLGLEFIISFSISFLKYLEPYLLKCKDTIDILNYIQNLSPQKNEDEEIFNENENHKAPIEDSVFVKTTYKGISDRQIFANELSLENPYLDTNFFSNNSSNKNKENLNLLPNFNVEEIIENAFLLNIKKSQIDLIKKEYEKISQCESLGVNDINKKIRDLFEYKQTEIYYNNEDTEKDNEKFFDEICNKNEDEIYYDDDDNKDLDTVKRKINFEENLNENDEMKMSKENLNEIEIDAVINMNNSNKENRILFNTMKINRNKNIFKEKLSPKFSSKQIINFNKSFINSDKSQKEININENKNIKSRNSSMEYDIPNEENNTILLIYNDKYQNSIDETIVSDSEIEVNNKNKSSINEIRMSIDSKNFGNLKSKN